jgi:hypothetical protein
MIVLAIITLVLVGIWEMWLWVIRLINLILPDIIDDPLQIDSSG